MTSTLAFALIMITWKVLQHAWEMKKCRSRKLFGIWPFVYKGGVVEIYICACICIMFLWKEGYRRTWWKSVVVYAEEDWMLPHLGCEACFWLHAWKLLSFIPWVHVSPSLFFFLFVKGKGRKERATAQALEIAIWIVTFSTMQALLCHEGPSAKWKRGISHS